jgi:hypothetical protein
MILSSLLIAVLRMTCSAVLQDPPAAEAESQNDLSRKATDPTASLMSMGFIFGYTGDYRGDQPGLEDHAWNLKFQPVIPFKAYDVPNILRVSLPYQLYGRGDDRLQDVSIFDLAVVPQSWGRWGLGPVMTFSTDPEAADAFVIGPALGGVYQASQTLNVGLFNQNVFGAHTAVSQFQPIAAYQLGNGWSLSAGDLQFAYDWHRDRWINLPIGAQLGWVTRFLSQPLRIAVNPQYNLVRDVGAEQWKILLSVTFLLPTQ